MVFHGFWLVYMVFNIVSWFFHGFWLVSMVFQGGFMVFGWFPWFFKVVSWFFMSFVGFYGFSRFLGGFSSSFNSPRLVKSELSAAGAK